VFFQEPARTEGDLNFRLFGIPVRVHPMFWLFTLLLGLSFQDPVALVTFVIAAFFSILIHELGHALVTRAFGFAPSIVLTMMGGLTFRGPSYSGARRPGPAGEILISAVGPGAQFALAAAIYFVLRLAGREVLVYTGLPVVALPILLEDIGSPAFTLFINQLMIVSVVWGLFNLLPIYPLDGGQIAREFLQRAIPREGLRVSLVISAATAIFVAAYSVMELHSPWMAVFIGYLGFLSLQALASYGRY
jgi:stage IV sporulation protein FB